MSRALDDLDSRFRPLAFELLARCVEQGIQIMIIDTLRTPQEHAINLASGASRIQRSKHLDGLAIDVCPYETWALDGPDKLRWDTSNPTVWFRLGRIGEALGLRWGGRFRPLDDNGLGWDAGHFEWVVPATGTVDV